MSQWSRREFICLSAALSLLCRFPALAAEGSPGVIFPETVKTLQQAYRAEMIAYNHYLGYTEKALEEGFPNIAYLFRSFAISEKIHADNYVRILELLKRTADRIPAGITINATRDNLKIAAKKELEKIESSYPEFIQTLEGEGCDEAILNCMYAWKSHRQHEEKVREVYRYAGMFFSSVASEIEGQHLNFHVCTICGSTIDKRPVAPCDICNKSKTHYQKVPRPASPT